MTTRKKEAMIAEIEARFRAIESPEKEAEFMARLHKLCDSLPEDEPIIFGPRNKQELEALHKELKELEAENRELPPWEKPDGRSRTGSGLAFCSHQPIQHKPIQPTQTQ